VSWQRDMERHIEVYHSGGKARGMFKCDLCENEYTREDNLTRHMRKHEEVTSKDERKGGAKAKGEAKGKGKGKAK